ncbi:hypothetical protein FRB90_001379 [Tulasnella sp. 427]|nr:hypothetical protein FRB90_001379 [Tulasnella sp. 427]
MARHRSRLGQPAAVESLSFYEGIKKRWGWDPDLHPALQNNPRFQALANSVKKSPSLSEKGGVGYVIGTLVIWADGLPKVWNQAGEVLRSIMEDYAKTSPTEPRHGLSLFRGQLPFSSTKSIKEQALREVNVARQVLVLSKKC